MQVIASTKTAELDAGTGISLSNAIELQREALIYQTGAGVAYGVAGAAVIASILFFVLDSDETVEVGAGATPGGAAARIRLRF